MSRKVKNFFGKKEAAPVSFDKLKKESYNISFDVLKDISAENSTSQRLKCIKDLNEIVLTKTLEKYAVEALCENVKDMLESQNHSTETRHMVYQFFHSLIMGQNDYMGTMRSYLFKLLLMHANPEDTVPRLEMLRALTYCGKNISYFEEELGPFLLLWFPDILNTDKTADFLVLVTNVIKFNAAYLDDEVISGFIDYISVLCSRTKFEDDVEASLNVLEAILCYSHLPNYALQRFVCTLCLTVNIEKFSQCSWKQMKNLLGTNVGHTCIFSLCKILQESNHNQSALLRGAIFFIGMALWGPNKVPTLIHPPTAVLPSFLKALECNDNIIAYEVILSLQRLVKSVEQLQSLSWEIIFNILENILEFPELQDGNDFSLLAKAVHDLISMAENSVSDSSQPRLFAIIEQCSSSRNEQSVMKLLAYNVEQMNPFREDFLCCLTKILEKYFKNEKRVAIQLEALKVVSHVRQNYGHLFEEDLVDQTILQYLSQLDVVPDAQVRRAAVELLIDMGYSCYSVLFVDILDIIEKVLKLSFDTLSGLSDNVATRDQFVDVSMAVQGVIKIFKKKLFVMPSNHCLSIFSGIINYIKLSYSHLSYNNEILSIRKMIIDFLLEFRANNQKQVGIVIGNNEKYSVHITCDANLRTELSGSSVPSSPAPCSPPAFGGPTLSYFSYKEAFEVLVLSLKQEKDWSILETIFQKLPKLLQNKSLIVQGNCSISSLCTTLCSMVMDRSKSLPDSLRNTPPRLTRTDVQGHIYPCICALTSYHAYLEAYMQRILIKCLQSGLVSRSAKLCIDGLMIGCLEMRNSMMKLLPDVLLRLSKISSTVNVAVSILQFLSNPIRLPQLYLSFVEDQYMSIFAIALPYTNPFKFNQYIVALAHHVIAMWFLKCRIPFRKDFAKFISKGLSSNIRLPREESGGESSTHKNQQEDSSAQTSEDKSKKMSNSAIIALHTELMETGLDLMARFTFGMSSNVPKRSPVSEFLLEKGQKSSWLVGNKVITITTSGCNTKSVKNGLCERCFNICVEFNKNADSFEKDPIFPEEPTVEEQRVPSFRFERKRHRSAIQRRSVTLSRDLMATQTKDDILLHFRRLQSVDSALRDEAIAPREEFSFLKSEQEKSDEDGHLCSCWCTNWAEVHIRRPTGNTSWLMKLQNQLFLPSSSPDVPLSLLTSMVLQGPWGQGPDSSLLFPMAEELLESDPFEVPCSEAIDITSYPSKTDPPMRRTNSSPDVNTMWLESTSSSSDADPFKRTLQESTDSAGGDAELEDSLSKIKQEDKKSSLRLDLRTESKHPDQPLRESEEAFAHRKAISMGPFRDRGHTISVMSPIHPKVSENASQSLEPNRRNGMNPSFVFLQLYHNSCFGQKINKPLLLPQQEANLRSLYILDHIPPYDTHKIGVVYVGEGQAADEVGILSNVYGSSRYVSFIRNLGNLVRLTDVDPRTTYLGGLDVRGEDGKFALIWHDDVMQVVFHVATLMVNKEKDPMRHEKKKHIANDAVMIVYNESGQDFSLTTIKGHVTNACVIISPKDSNCNTVSVKLKTEELSDMFGHFETYMISDESLPVFVRQLALHANLASLIMSRQQQSNNSHVSNWLERLRTIKRLRSKVLEELKNANDNFNDGYVDDKNYDSFTDYV